MKKFVLLLLLIIMAGITIFYGRMEYNKKIQQSVFQAQGEMDRYNEELEERQQQEELERQNYILSLVKNMDQQLSDMFVQAIEKEEFIHVVAMGSAALSAEDDELSWPRLVENAVNERYGTTIIKVDVLSYGRENTFEVVRKGRHLNAAEMNPDIFILEPFIWNDNGNARIVDTLYHVDVIIDAVQSENEDVIVLIQPPNPIYGAGHYINQVNALKDHAKENNLRYIDHWQNWTESTDEALHEFITEESIPNQEGHEIWSDYIIDFFAAN